MEHRDNHIHPDVAPPPAPDARERHPGARRRTSEPVAPEPPGSLLIDGLLRLARGGRDYPVLDPATGQEFARCPDASAADADEAVRAARRAFDDTVWRNNPGLRSECLRRLLVVLDQHREKLRDLLVREAGVPIRLTRSVQLDGAFADVAWICDLLDRYPWHQRLPDRSFHSFPSRRTQHDEAIGVAALLTPANFPLTLMLRMLFLALAAGNTVVLKPSPHVPLVALTVARLAAESGEFPPGVLNVLTAADPVRIGLMLAGHELIDLVGLTGSTPTGRQIARAAAPTLKRTVLHLGGHGAHIVLNDAHPEVAAASGARVCFHAGQACSLFKRLLVPRHLYRDAVDLAREAMAAVPFGDPRDPVVTMGPLVSAALRDRVLEVRDRVVRAGGQVHYSGGAPDNCSRGYFVPPTLITGLPADAHLARHELPGPMLLLQPYDTEAEAITMANAPPYGLSAAISSGSVDRARSVAARLRVGAIMVNDGLPYGPDAPYVALRQSGNGHNGGEAALRDYLVTKVIGYPG
ncbi:MAG: aldehyde dehydrogenase family protein [Pseudonocardiaceae bacterium]